MAGAVMSDISSDSDQEMNRICDFKTKTLKILNDHQKCYFGISRRKRH